MTTEFRNRAEYEEFLKHLLEEYPDTPLTDWPSILIQTINYNTTDETDTPVREQYIDYYGSGKITVDGSEYSRTIPPEHILKLHGENPDMFDSDDLNSRASDHMRKDLQSLRLA